MPHMLVEFLVLLVGDLAARPRPQRGGLVDGLVLGELLGLAVLRRLGDELDLSPREQEILDYVCRGKSNADVARTLDISPYTVKNRRQVTAIPKL